VGVRLIRKLLSVDGVVPVNEILATGVLPRLVSLLAAEGEPDLQLEASWALTNIASTDYTRVVVESGALAPLSTLMMSPVGNVREQAMWCVGNIAGDRAAFRDAAFGTVNCVNALLTNIMHPESTSLMRNATWALSNFARGRPAVSPANAAEITPAFAYLLDMDDVHVLVDALWGLCYLTESDEGLLDTVLAANPLPGVMKALARDEISVLVPALRLVGNFISGTAVHTQAAIDAGAMHAMVRLVSHPRRNVRREACWCVSNVAAGTHAQIEAVMSTPGLLEGVMEQARMGEWNVRKEATWVFCNIAAAGTEGQVCRIMAGGLAETLMEVLQTDDARFLEILLDGVAVILRTERKLKDSGNPAAACCNFAAEFEEYGIIVRLQELQDHESTAVYEKALALGETYYAADGGDAAAAEVENASAPALVSQPGGGKAFAFGGAVANPFLTGGAGMPGFGGKAATPAAAFGGAAANPFAAFTAAPAPATTTSFASIAFV